MSKEVLIFTYALDDELDKAAIEEVVNHQEKMNEINLGVIGNLFKKISMSKMKDREVVLCKTGVGKVNSTALLRDILDITMEYGKKYADRLKITVVNLGTAASALEEPGIIVNCNRFIDRDIVRISGNKYINECDWLAGDTRDFSSEGNHKSRYSCNTGDRFVTDIEDAHQMRDGWIAVCDMEAFPQKRLCNYYSNKYGVEINFICNKFITDKIGENSISNWDEMLPEAKDELTKLAMDYVRDFYEGKDLENLW